MLLGSRVASVFALHHLVALGFLLGCESIRGVDVHLGAGIQKRAVSLLVDLFKAFFGLVIGELRRHYFHVLVAEGLPMRRKQFRLLHGRGQRQLLPVPLLILGVRVILGRTEDAEF